MISLFEASVLSRFRCFAGRLTGRITRLSCRRGTARHCASLTLMVLYTMVDAQRDKQSTVVGRSKLTTLAMVNVPWRKEAEKSAKLRVWDEVPQASPLFFFF